MGDWIPMEKIRNLSLKKTILLYFVISLTAAFLLSGFTVHFARNMQNKIWEKYIDYADYTDVFQQYGKKYEIEISRPNQSQMNRLDHHLSEMCDFMETYSVLIFSIVGSVACLLYTSDLPEKKVTDVDELPRGYRTTVASVQIFKVVQMYIQFPLLKDKPLSLIHIYGLI